jgi:CBS domain-containing protein
MQAKDLISDVVPAVQTTDSGAKALNWMEIFRISHLPIVDNDEFLGLISDNDIYDYNMADEPIGSHKLSLFRPFIMHDKHIYDVIDLVAKQKLSIIPVLNAKMKYLGIITLHDLVQHFSNFTAAQEPGAVMVLEMNHIDYSLAQISGIVEGNGAKILSSYIHTSDESTLLNVTIKLNTLDISAIRQTFERYDYTVKTSYSEEDKMKRLVEDRYEEFMNYLNI